MVRTSSVSSVGLVMGALLLGACSRNNIEAVNLANEGDRNVREKNDSAAIVKFDQATKLDPENHKIAKKLALAYHRMATQTGRSEDWAKVASAFGKAESAAEAADKKKSYADYYFYHGYALEQVAATAPATGTAGSSWADAKAPLLTAAQLDPNYAQAYEEIGNIELRLDNESAALQNYTKAIETKPNELQFYPPLADLYRRLGFYDQAEQVLRGGLGYGKAGDPKDGDHLFSMHAQLGLVYEARGKMPEAVTEYELAQKSCGDCKQHPEAPFLLGGAYADLGRKSEAMQNLTAFTKVSCKGAAAKKFEVQCGQAREIAQRFGQSL